MTSTTGWIAGRGAASYTAAFNSSDFTGSQPTNGQALMSTLLIDNTSNLDQFSHFSILQSISSSTIAAGANFALWLCSLKADGSTYWPPLTAGTAGSAVPPWAPCAIIPLYAAGSQTTLVGSTEDIGAPFLIPPGKWHFIMQNNCGFTLTGGTQIWQYKTLNINLND